jgi:hypothetical protein
MTTRRYKIECSGTTHTVEYHDGGELVFVDHEPDFAEHWQNETMLAILGNESDDMLALVTEHEGCKRVACRIAGGPGNHCNRDPDERRLYAELRGLKLAAKLKLRRQA